MIKITLVFRFIVILLIGLPMQANANENCLIDPMEIRELGLSIDHSTEIGDSEQFFKLLNSKLSKDLIACGVLMKFDDESLEKAIDGNNLQIFAHILKTIRNQDLETLSKGKSVHSRDYWGRALFRAIAKKNYVVARHLFKNTESRSHNFFSGEHDSYVKAQVMMSAAIKNDDPEMVKILMAGGVDFENKSKTPWIEQIGYKLVYGTREFDVSNGFLEALENDSVKVVSYILKRASGIRFLERSKYVLSLQYSLRSGGMPSKRMIAAFFDEGVSYKDMYGLDDKASLLSMAIGKNDDDMLSYLMETQNVPISEDGHDIRTAGLNAVLLERVLKYQLKQDPKWTFSDDSFWNKLNTISDENDDKLSGQMRTRTAIIRDIVGRTGSFALEREQSHIAAIKVFMALAINKNDKLALNTLLAASIGDENFYVAKYFIEQGADTNVKMRGESGETFGTLDITLSNCELPMAKLLLDNGADLLAQIRAIGSERPASDYSKNMTYSKEVYQKEVQADLLSRLNYCDSNPQLQEEMIRRIAQTKVIDLNYRDEGGEGLTLLERAILSKQPYVARALLQNGADPRTLDKGKYNLSYAIEHEDKRW